MARTAQYGIKYFPMMVNIAGDDKILKAELQMGTEFLAVFPVAVKLLCWTYERDGYLTKWGETECLIFSKRMFSIEYSNTVNRAVQALIDADFFDRKMYDTYGILTSHGIQVQWSAIIASTKGRARIKPEYIIEDKNIKERKDIHSETMTDETETMTDETESMQQSKVNKSKLNKSITYLLKGEVENENFRYHTDVVFLRAPTVEKNMPPPVMSTTGDIDECLISYFKQEDFEEDRYLLCTSHQFQTADGKVYNDLLYAWARCFNRFLFSNGMKKKTIKNWLAHFKNWLPKQSHEINPDELNQQKNEKSNTKSPKVGGVSLDKARDFFNRPDPIIRRNKPPTTQGSGNTQS